MVTWESFPLMEKPQKGAFIILIILFCGYFIEKVTGDYLLTVTGISILFIAMKNGFVKTVYKVSEGNLIAKRAGGGFEKKLADCEFFELKEEGLYFQFKDKSIKTGFLIPIGNGNRELLKKEISQWCQIKTNTKEN